MDAEHRTGLQFFAEALGAVVLLALTTIFARRVHLPPGTAPYVLVQLAPIVPVWLMLLAMLRHYLRIDELQRLQFLQAMALTAGILAGIAWSYPAVQRAFALSAPLEMWEVHASILFVVISALMTKIRVAPRAR
ncbi:MAG TPA: hypothetical protein VNU97_03280 [Rhizomicrobium sp.]|jgi:hypothetical protein|nr:hypothetical protein [Rhizomicrobium sp.]